MAECWKKGKKGEYEDDDPTFDFRSFKDHIFYYGKKAIRAFIFLFILFSPIIVLIWEWDGLLFVFLIIFMMIGFHLIFDKDIKISKENQEKIYRFSCPVITIFILSKWYFFLTDLVSSKKVSMSDYQINTQYILIGSLFILFGIMVYFWIRNWFVHNKESGILVANLNLFYLLFIVMVGISIHLLDQLSKSYLQDPIENGLMVLVLVELGLLLWKISQKTLSLRKMLAHSEGDKLGGKNEKPQPISTQTVNENSDYKPVVLQEIPPEISIQTKEVVSDGEPDGINVTPLDPLNPPTLPKGEKQ